jgi:hypothetical protein
MVAWIDCEVADLVVEEGVELVGGVESRLGRVEDDQAR